MAEWQKMDSAPRDGTVILLAQGDDVFAGFYDKEDGAFPWVFLDRGIPGVWTNGFKDDDGRYGPYAWAPMPKYEAPHG